MTINPLHLFNLNFSKNKKLFNSLFNLLGFVPCDTNIYRQALTHSSYTKNFGSKLSSKNNERLEFLGDAVLDTIVGEILFKKFPYKGEGFLTEMRSKVVSRENLSKLAKKMDLQHHIYYDKSYNSNSTFINQISGNAFEAIIGAIYLDKGYDFTLKFFENRIFKLHIDINHLETTEVSFKGKLFKYCQKQHQKLLLECEEKIIEKKKIFKIVIKIDDIDIASHEHLSKKLAEELACTKACKLLIKD